MIEAHTMPANPLGDFIDKRMRDRQIPSVSELARRIGKSHTYVRQLIQGVNPSTGRQIEPSVGTWDRLSMALGVTPDELRRISRGESPESVLGDRSAETAPERMRSGGYPATPEETRIVSEAERLGIRLPILKMPSFWDLPPEKRRANFRNLEGLIEETIRVQRMLRDEQ